MHRGDLETALELSAIPDDGWDYAIGTLPRGVRWVEAVASLRLRCLVALGCGDEAPDYGREVMPRLGRQSERLLLEMSLVHALRREFNVSSDLIDRALREYEDAVSMPAPDRIEPIRQMAEPNPGRFGPAFAVALATAYSGDLEGATTAMREVCETFARMPASRYHLAQLTSLVHGADAAAPLAREALDLSAGKQVQQAGSLLAECLAGSDDLAGLQRLTEEMPQCASAWSYLLSCAEAAGEDALALGAARELAHRFSGSPAHQGACFLSQRPDPETQIEGVEALKALHPWDTTVALWFGHLHFDRGDNRRAATHYATVARRTGGSFPAWLSAAAALMRDRSATDDIPPGLPGSQTQEGG